MEATKASKNTKPDGDESLKAEVRDAALSYVEAKEATKKVDLHLVENPAPPMPEVKDLSINPGTIQTRMREIDAQWQGLHAQRQVNIEYFLATPAMKPIIQTMDNLAAEYRVWEGMLPKENKGG